VGSEPTSVVKDNGLFWGLLALLFWAPLPLGSNRIWAIGILLLWALALLAGAAWVWRHSLPAALARLSRFSIPLSLLAVMVVLAWGQSFSLRPEWVVALSPEAAAVQAGNATQYLSLDPFQTRIMAALAFTYFAVFLVAILTVRSAERLDRVAQLLVWSGVFQATAGAVLFSLGAHYRLFHSDVIHTRILGTYVYHNSMAGYLCMCLAIGIGLMLARLGGEKRMPADWKKRLSLFFAFLIGPKMRLRLMLVVMVIGLVLTRSRMGNAAFFSAMLVVGLLTIVLVRKTAPTTLALIASLVIIDILVVGGWIGLEKVVQRVQDTALTTEAGGREESVEARTEAGRSAIAIVEDFPAVGSGGGTFYSTFMSYRTPREGYIDHAHNDFVEIAADFGLVGLTTLGLLVALALWTSLKVLATRRSNLPRGIAFGVAMSIVALLIHSTVDFNLQIPANALTMVVILALAWIARELPSTPSRRSRSGA
jgi:O-antigen ligase